MSELARMIREDKRRYEKEAVDYQVEVDHKSLVVQHPILFVFCLAVFPITAPIFAVLWFLGFI